MNNPVKTVVKITPKVESIRPGPSTGLISLNRVSIPPVNKMTLKDSIPIACASAGLLNSMPNPSVPKIMPVKRNSNKVGMPNLYPVLLMRMLMNISPEPKKNIFSVVNVIYYHLIGSSILCRSVCKYRKNRRKRIVSRKKSVLRRHDSPVFVSSLPCNTRGRFQLENDQTCHRSKQFRTENDQTCRRLEQFQTENNQTCRRSKQF